MEQSSVGVDKEKEKKKKGKTRHVIVEFPFEFPFFCFVPVRWSGQVRCGAGFSFSVIFVLARSSLLKLVFLFGQVVPLCLRHVFFGRGSLECSRRNSK